VGRRVAIAGVALSDCGRVDARSPFELHHQAASRALADAGLEKSEVDGFASCGTGLLAPVELAEYLGLRPTWVDGTGVGGSTWEFMVEHATAAIAERHAEVVVLAYASTARADLKRRERRANLSFGSRGPVQFDTPFGHTLIAKYAMAARRHMHEFGTTIDQLAEIAVSTRANASLNPDAYYREPITIDEVNSAPLIADPLTTLHCCIRSDGGGAVVLTSEDRVRDLAAPPVWVLGTGEAVSHTTMSEWEDFTESPAVRSGKLAFERAGVTPEDIDVCEIYDAFTPMVLLSFEALGFCKKGEGGPFVESGTMRVDGSLPTNTDGGGLSACHPGMRGIFLLVEAVHQLRGEAGHRQVAGAELGCVNGTGGWFSSASTAILGVE
jgi:acetyl-CoA acetyltransferase